jgi:N-acetyl-D-muramate 6-phosphate phosphatase
VSLPLRAVLFDLDGTVLDTAPDFHRILNAMLLEHGREPLPYTAVRPNVSHGAGRVVRAGFPDADERQFADLQQRFLELYRGSLSVETRLFDGMAQVLEELAARGLHTGIVTNKAAWLTEPLLEEMGLREAFRCVVSGDTVAERKPHPLPMLHAATLTGVDPHECVYVGDAERDIQAAHRAGMPGLVANYGYVPSPEATVNWRGDGYLETPLELLGWLDASGRA